MLEISKIGSLPILEVLEAAASVSAIYHRFPCMPIGAYYIDISI
jgi:hypothetical protein